MSGARVYGKPRVGRKQKPGGRRTSVQWDRQGGKKRKKGREREKERERERARERTFPHFWIPSPPPLPISQIEINVGKKGSPTKKNLKGKPLHFYFCLFLHLL